jgi:hypothetical protein
MLFSDYVFDVVKYFAPIIFGLLIMSSVVLIDDILFYFCLFILIYPDYIISILWSEFSIYFATTLIDIPQDRMT